MRFLTAVCVLTLGPVAELVACSCPPPPPPKKSLEFATAVFFAEVTGIETAGEERTVTLKVEKWWKGGETAEITVSTAKSGATCGYGFEKGKKYLVYARREENTQPLHVSLCSRTRTEAEADKSGDFKELGEGKKPREALALKAELDGDTAKITVAFNYTGKPGDPATFQGVRLYKYYVPVGKGPAVVGWQGKEGRQSVVLGGKKYPYYPAQVDRQENGSLSVTKDGEKIRVTGVYHAYGTLFVIGETVKPGDPILLEEVAVDLRDSDGKVLVAADGITAYEWKTHTLTLTPEATVRLRKALHDEKKLDKPFTVALGGKAVYDGQLITVLSSRSYNGVILTVDVPQADQAEFFRFPLVYHGKGKDPREDETVKAVLRLTGKLK